jgi:acetamidase/formamidase
MKELRAAHDTVHFGFYDATLRPVLNVESDEEIAFTTLSAHPDDKVPADWLPPEVHEIYTRALRRPGPHVLTGPIAVGTAKPGDVLQVDIREIRLRQPYGYNIVSPLKGMFGTEFPALKTSIMPIDLKTGLAEVVPGIKIPTQPFFGQLAVAPPREWGRLDSRPPNKFGGNIDNKELLPGTRLFLPIFVENALFSIGDGHAAQGDGEVNQTAVETSLSGRVRLTVRKDLKTEWPFAVTHQKLITMAFNESLDVAARLAMRNLISLLEMHYGLEFHDAYRLCSAAADMRVSQFVNGNRGIHVVLSHGPLANLAAQPPFFDGIEEIEIKNA